MLHFSSLCTSMCSHIGMHASEVLPPSPHLLESSVLSIYTLKHQQPSYLWQALVLRDPFGSTSATDP